MNYVRTFLRACIIPAIVVSLVKQQDKSLQSLLAYMVMERGIVFEGCDKADVDSGGNRVSGIEF